MGFTRCVGSGDLQIGSLVAPCAGWVASITVIHSSLRFASLEAWTHQSQGKSRHFTIVLWQKTLGFRTHSIGCLESPRGRSNWKMVSVHFFCFQLFNYRNPWHQIHCSRQGNRSKRRNKWRHVVYHARRDEKRRETDYKRSLRRASRAPGASNVLIWGRYRSKDGEMEDMSRDILSLQRTYRQYIVCYNDNLHFHVFSDHCTIHLCLGVFAIGLFSSRWMGITSVPSK